MLLRSTSACLGPHLPPARPGQVIGLLGGSFDPAHQGHVNLSKTALKQFALDQLWWLVTPGNPLKTNGPAPLDQRLRHAKSLFDHPRVTITGLESQLKTRYSIDTITALKHRYPGVRFVWLMGADNLAQFHRWRNWQDIMAALPIGVLARPGDRLAARLSPAARRFSSAQIPGRASHSIGTQAAPAWCFVNMPMSDQSSTAIRKAGQWSGATK